MNSKMKKAAAVVMLFSMLAGMEHSHPGMRYVSAASGPKLSKKIVEIKKGKSAKITLKNKAGAKKIKWSIANKRVAQIKAKNAKAQGTKVSGAFVTVKGKKAGQTKLTCQFSYHGKKKTLTGRIRVKNTTDQNGGGSSGNTTPALENPDVTQAPPAPQQPDQPGNPGATEPPVQTPVQTATPEPIPVLDDVDASTKYDIQGSLKGAYQRFFGNVGTSVNIFQIEPSGSIFENAGDMFAFTKSQYNSITPENETKPCRLLNMGTNFEDYFATDFKAQTMPVSEAKADPYYYVPENYKEEVCPKINYSQFDIFLKKAAENGMRIRFHAFVWHQQTPEWLFKENFDADADWVTPEVMDARLEYYIKSVIRYITLKEQELGYGNVVYCYDVANEYFHNNDKQDKDNSYIKSYWDEVYYPDNKFDKNTGKYDQVAEPVYIKRAFTYAREILDSYEKQDVSLFYNDYNTYMVSDSILTLVEYINQDQMLCDGIGMQSHLDINYPTVENYAATLKKFLACEKIREVQITELDVTAGSSDKLLERQMDYYYDLMKAILDARKDYPGKITGMTFWGLYDGFSWRREKYPLLFASTTEAKGAYYKVLQAAAEAVEEEKAGA